MLRGEGVWLHTRDGRRVLDLYGGHAVAALGYGHPAWTRAVNEQNRNLNFQSNAVPLDVRTRAASKLIAFSRLPVKSVFFVNSGAEANENALKMAFTLNPGRTEVVALEQGFHGRMAAGHEQVDALGAQQDGAAQLLRAAERQQVCAQRGQLRQRREAVGGDIGDGGRRLRSGPGFRFRVHLPMIGQRPPHIWPVPAGLRENGACPPLPPRPPGQPPGNGSALPC